MRVGLLLTLLPCLLHPAGYALNGKIDVSRYLRREWGARQFFDGAPISALAQTPDGYLWLSTSKGLYRFDGKTFEVMHPGSLSSSPITNVLEFVVDSEGGLWMWLQDARLFRYKANAFSLVLASREIIGDATAIAPSNDGGVLVATLGAGMLKIHGEVKSRLPGQAKGFVAAIAQSKDGKIWLGTHDEGLYFSESGVVYQVRAGSLNTKINCLLSDSAGKLWIGTDDGLAFLDERRIGTPEKFLGFHHSQILGLLEDRDKNIWVTTHAGVFRLGPDGKVQLVVGEAASNIAASVLEDRERSIWIGDSRGLRQLRDGVFTEYLSSNHVAGDRKDSVFGDPDGTLWLAPNTGGLSFLQGGKAQRVKLPGLNNDIVYSIDGSNHELWLGRQRGGLTHLHRRRDKMDATTYTTGSGLAQNTIYAVRLVRDGSVWASSLNAGLSHLQNGQFTTFTSASGLGSDDVSAIEEGDTGTMWFGTSSGLSSLTNGRWQTYRTTDGLPSDQVQCLFHDREGVLWIGTKSGLAARSNNSFQHTGVLNARTQLDEPILGITEDKRGSLWVATSAHVFSLNRMSTAKETLDDGQLRQFGPEDGLMTTEGVQRSRSVIADPLGRIWFSLTHEIAMVDPDELTTHPTIAHVTSVTADGRVLPADETIKVSSSQHRLVFHYTGLSLAMPDRVRFRYRLMGFDPGWSDPDGASEAVYTNLRPGSYTFQLEAFNDLELKTSSRASVALVIEPTLWQGWFFRSACALAALFGIVALYRIRMAQLLKQANVRFEERLAERARIARDLHDTLLQGFLSASMQLHVAAEQVPPDSPAKPLLSRILELMRQVTEEGRNALRGLRSNEAPDESLEASFSHLTQSLGRTQSASYRTVVQGTSRALHPIIHEEMRRIGQEALLNAGRHARASNIEVAIYYNPRSLVVTIQDDGCGIEPGVLEQGRPGHWGLPGMRERADRVGAKMQLFSSKLAGTEVRVSVPGRIAYKQFAENRVFTFFRRLIAGPRRTSSHQRRSL